jgi:hypothetical protein
VSTESQRGWGVAICALLALGLFIGTLVMIAQPPARPLTGWIGVAVLGAVLVLMWESTKKIGGH